MIVDSVVYGWSPPPHAEQVERGVWQAGADTYVDPVTWVEWQAGYPHLVRRDLFAVQQARAIRRASEPDPWEIVWALRWENERLARELAALRST